LVEAAIVIPLLLLFVFGVVDFGAVYSNRTTVNQGVRDAVRQGIVANFGTNSTCPITGSIPSGNSRNLVCLAKERVALQTVKTRIKIVAPVSYTIGSQLLVCAEYPIEPVTPLTGQFLSNDALHAKATMRVEQVAPAGITSVSETAIDGDWSWCT
jgi:Flp pilus assembly protein TadG